MCTSLEQRAPRADPGDYGDAFLNRYLLQWDVHSLFSRSVLSPTMFWPSHDVLAYSDPGLAIAPVAAVLRLFLSWTVIYNTIYLGCWVASQAFTYLLARWLRASRPAAVLAALGYFASQWILALLVTVPLIWRANHTTTSPTGRASRGLRLLASLAVMVISLVAISMGGH